MCLSALWYEMICFPYMHQSQQEAMMIDEDWYIEPDTPWYVLENTEIM